MATLNGRTRTWMRDEVTRTFLEKLFASVTQQYETWDGRVVNGTATVTQSVTTLTLINADTDQPIMALAMAWLRFADLPTRNLNVRAEPSPSVVGSIRFGPDGQSHYRTETSSLLRTGRR